MARRRKAARQPKTGPVREQFSDGSALVTYPDGTQMILESDLAKAMDGLQERQTVSYGKRGRKVTVKSAEGRMLN